MAITVTVKGMVTGAFMPSFTDSVTVAEPALTPVRLIVPGVWIAAVTTVGLSTLTVAASASLSGSTAA